MIVLLVAGICLAVAGLLAVGFGVPIKDTTFGNAAILGGVIILGSGAILIGLALVVRELKNIARLLAQGDVRVTSLQQKNDPVVPKQAGGLFSAPAPALGQEGSRGPGSTDVGMAVPNIVVREESGVAPTTPAQPPPWADEAMSRERARSRLAGEAAPPPPPEIEISPPIPPIVLPTTPERPPRRNLLFATKRRTPAEQASDALATSTNETARGAEAADAASGIVRPPLSPHPESKTSFDAAWPRPAHPDGTVHPDATHSSENPVELAQGGHGGVTGAADAAASHPEPVPNLAPKTEVTVIKSGIVDGMAYTLYSDGSIEAQMPEGMIRFASLDELRNYLEQRP